MLLINWTRKEKDYVSAETLMGSQEKFGVELNAPVANPLRITKEMYLPLQTARERQTLASFWRCFKFCSWIEGTIGFAVDTLGMRRTRYRGLAKTYLHYLLTATAIKVKRVLNWLADLLSSRTRISHFAALAPI